MALVVTQRIPCMTGFPGRSLLSAGRRLTNQWSAHFVLTPQERANRYVSRMPIAVVTASLGGHPDLGTNNYR